MSSLHDRWLPVIMTFQALSSELSNEIHLSTITSRPHYSWLCDYLHCHDYYKPKKTVTASGQDGKQHRKNVFIQPVQVDVFLHFHLNSWQSPNKKSISYNSRPYYVLIWRVSFKSHHPNNFIQRHFMLKVRIQNWHKHELVKEFTVFNCW